MDAKYYRKRYATAGDLAAAMKPIRTVREVAKLTGLSRGTVFNTERDALRKIREGMLAATNEAQPAQRISWKIP